MAINPDKFEVNSKLMVGMVYFVLAGILALSLIDFFAAENIVSNPDSAGNISIFSSVSTFRAYHIWLMIMAVVTWVAFFFRQKRLLLICIMILILLWFFPQLANYGLLEGVKLG